MDLFFSVFEKYGLQGVIVLVLCAVLYFMFKKFGNNLVSNMSTGLEKLGEKLTDQISNQNIKLVDTIIDQQKNLVGYLLNRESNEKQKHDNMLGERIIVADDVNMKCKEIMLKHRAKRAFTIEFHNSYTNISGIPFAKYSINYEWFDKGVYPLQYKAQGLPFSGLAKIVKDIYNTPNQQIVYDDLNKFENENPVLMSLFRDDNTKAFIYTGVHDNRNMLIGFLVLEYQEEIDKDKLNLDQLRVESAEITSMLNIRYKYKNL